ncbi:hypothetical protein SLS56_007288 [Neofusicoccum ribis]|uniref:Uncharacterized protein n=1 Tax=Neofusicoccum ribis TaxID=45134 RepID=A0ABR3SNB7_9PEZI
MPVPNEHHAADGAEASTTVLLPPTFTMFDNVTPSLVSALIQKYVDTSPTNTTPLVRRDSPQRLQSSHSHDGSQTDRAPDSSALIPRDCPHEYLILLCSHKTRDARCGQSAPLLRREFERHLRPLGLYRDLHDERPGGCGIYFINHVGGHKFAANVIIYRRASSAGVVVPPAVEREEPADREWGGSAVASKEVEAMEEPSAEKAAAPSKPPIREVTQYTKKLELVSRIRIELLGSRKVNICLCFYVGPLFVQINGKSDSPGFTSLDESLKGNVEGLV